MKVSNMTNARGNKIANQVVIHDGNKETFQSYRSVVAINDEGAVTLDYKTWDYSRTTLKYLKQFLNTSASKKEIQARIDNGEYKTANLN